MGEVELVVTRIDPLFFPHVAGVATALAVILLEFPIIAVAITEHPVIPSVTVTV